LIKLIVIGFLVWLVYRTLKGIFSVKKEQGSVNEQISEMVQDPSCLTFIPKTDARRRVINGKTYYFCSDECAARFEKAGKVREQISINDNKQQEDL